MKAKKVLVTVGTTKFEKLINTVSDSKVLDKLHSLGYQYILFQTGNGRYKKVSQSQLTINYTDFLENFTEEIENADLIISHAGAGSCIDVLTRKKPLIVVVNEDLMDNHQHELATQLYQEGYLYKCICSNLLETLNEDLDKLKKYVTKDKFLFSKYLDKYMGFS